MTMDNDRSNYWFKLNNTHIIMCNIKSIYNIPSILKTIENEYRNVKTIHIFTILPKRLFGDFVNMINPFAEEHKDIRFVVHYHKTRYDSRKKLNKHIYKDGSWVVEFSDNYRYYICKYYGSNTWDSMIQLTTFSRFIFHNEKKEKILAYTYGDIFT